MEQTSFGQILKDTRKRKGLDLNATARRLRIRPDILKAIEDSNFAAMPPRGYTRNMVNGYARYLGLNPTEITGMYLDELYAYQVNCANARQRPSGIDMSEAPDNTRVPRRSGEGRSRVSQSASQYSRENSARRSKVSSDRQRTRTSRRTSTEGRTHQARGSLLPNTEYTNYYSGPGGEGGLRPKLPYIIAAAIALLLVFLLGWLLFGRGSGRDETVPNVPVTGVSSETGEGASSVPKEEAPTKFTFEYTVDDGQTSWIEVYVDGEAKVTEEAVGPSTQSFDSSGTLQFICANPSGVTARLDGTELLMQPDASGIVNMTIDFKEILAKWQSEHGQSAKSSSSSSSSSKQAAATDSGTRDAGAEAQTETQADAGTADTGEVYYDAGTANDQTYYDNTYSNTYDNTYNYGYDATYNNNYNYGYDTTGQYGYDTTYQYGYDATYGYYNQNATGTGTY